MTRKDFVRDLGIFAATAFPHPRTSAMRAGLHGTDHMATAVSQGPTVNSLVVNVRDYGVAGDGQMDDTQALQSVLQNSNSVIFFPAGTYLISGALNIAQKSNLHIRATGAIIENASSTGDTLHFESCEKISVHGGTFTRTQAVSHESSSSYHCFFFGACSDVSVEGVTIDGSPGMGVCFVAGVGIKSIKQYYTKLHS